MLSKGQCLDLNDELKKHILLKLDLELPLKVQEIASEQGFDLSSDSEREYQFIITDHYNGEEVFLKPCIAICEIEDTTKFYKNGGQAIINTELLESEVGQALLKRLLGASSSLSFDKLTSNFNGDTSSFKMTDPHSIGMYEDIISADALAVKANGAKVRHYFHSLSLFVSMLKDSRSLNLPLEVDYGLTKDGYFVIQSFCSIVDFGKELFWNEEKLKEGHLKSFNEALGSVDIFDCYTLGSNSKLVMTAMWNLEKDVSFKTSLFNDIPSFKKVSFVRKHEGPEVIGKTEKSETSENEELFNKDSNVIKDLMSESNRKNDSLRRIIEFLMSENSEEALKEFDVEKLKEVLQFYPIRSVVMELAEEDYSLILEGLNNIEEIVETKEEIKEAKKKKAFGSIFSDIVTKVKEFALEEAEEVIKISGGSDESELVQKVSGWKEEEEPSTLVKGESEDLGEENTLVSGSKEDLTEESTTIKGSPEDLKDEAWHVKRLAIAEEIEKNQDSLSIMSVEQAQEEVEEIISKILEVSKEEANPIARDIIESSPGLLSTTNDSKESGLSSDGGAHLANLENQKLKNEISKKDKQLEKMQELVASMRGRIAAQLEAERALKSEEGGELTVEQVQIQLTNAMSEIAKRETHIDSLQDKLGSLSENYEDKIKGLNSQIDDLKAKKAEEKTDSIDQSALDDLEQKLKLANERFESVNEKLEAANKETADINEKLLDAKKENTSYLTEIATLKSNVATLENTVEVSAVDDSAEKAKELEVNNKTLELKAKQLEQKNKFLNGKLKEMEKKLKKSKSAGGASANGAGSAQVKQLEVKNERLQSMQNKVQNDLAEKKKELHKAKTESNAMKLRIQELERKLSKYEKNAA